MTQLRESFTRRMALSRHIRRELAETLSTARERARWLKAEAQMLEREARNAGRPRERFDVDTNDAAEAF